jgi:hypothetical protein
MRTTHIWDQKSLPHKGWDCINVEDLQEATHTCQMCGKEEIRHVFHLEHPEGHSVAVGCECAGHLTEQYQRMRELNKQSQSLANKKKYHKTKIEKIKQEWFEKDWYLQHGTMYRVSKDILGKIEKKRTGWKYKIQIYIAPFDILEESFSMFEEQAKTKIEDYIKSLSKL